ncbi:MAG: hypothetical protein IVW55_09345 [Chloroflexi bacterium]|nr:hypothetical protein [Chloroflexota bacterium]
MNNVRMYIAPTTAHFNDVPVGSTFYSYVETAYAHFAMAPVSTGVFGVNNSVLRGDVATAFFRLTALERQFTHNGSSGHSGPYEGSNNYVLGPPLSCTNPTPNMSGAYQDTPAGSEAGFTQDYGGFSNFGVIGREISFSPNAKAYLACTASNKVAIVFHVFNNVGSNPSYASGCQAGTWDYPSFATNLPDAGQVVKPGCTFSNAEIRIYSNSPNLLDTSSAQYFVYDDWTPDNGNNRGEINIDNYQLNSNNDPISVNGYDAKDNMQKFCMRKGDAGASYAGNQYGVFPCP